MATSPIAASRLVARNISPSGFTAIQDRFEAWIQARGDSAVASDALVGALNFSKDPDKVLAEAKRIYDAAIANGDDAGSGLSEEEVGAIVDTKTAVLGQKFRGDWSPGELVWSEDFSAGLPAGAPWTFNWASGTTGSSPVSVVAMSASVASGTKPAYANCLKVPSNGSVANDTTRAILDLNAIPALAGKALTTISYWSVEKRELTGGSPTNQFRDGATVKFTHTVGDNGTYPWTRQTYSLAGVNSDLTWETIVNGSANPNNSFFIAGLEISAVGQPYNLGEFVLYKGKMWKSTSNNNTTTPGVSATWTEVPAGGSVAYTTAARPAATDAGVGAVYYDITLSKPAWSNGTVWKDAAGTTV